MDSAARRYHVPAAEMYDEPHPDWRTVEVVRASDLEPSAAYSLLEQLDHVLDPLDSKIDFSLHVGTVGQMRADLSYLRGLLGEAHTEIKKVLDADA